MFTVISCSGVMIYTMDIVMLQHGARAGQAARVGGAWGFVAGRAHLV